MVRFPIADGTFDRPAAGQDRCRDDGRQLRLRTVRSIAVPACADGRLEGRLRADAAGLLRLDRGRPRDAQDDPRPDLQRRDVLRDRVPGLRVLPRPGRRRRPGRTPGWTEGAKTGINDLRLGGDVLRRHAVRLLAGPAEDGPAADGDRGRAVPDVHHDRDERPGDPDRQRDAALRPAGRRLLHRGARRRSRDLRSRRRLPGQDDHRLPRVRARCPATRVTTCPNDYVDEYVAERPRRGRPTTATRSP